MRFFFPLSSRSLGQCFQPSCGTQVVLAAVACSGEQLRPWAGGALLAPCLQQLRPFCWQSAEGNGQELLLSGAQGRGCGALYSSGFQRAAGLCFLGISGGAGLRQAATPQLEFLAHFCRPCPILMDSRGPVGSLPLSSEDQA